jgi:hypothetical protein
VIDRIKAFNDVAAEKVTAALSNMWAGYLFAAISLVSLPAVLRTHDVVAIVAWLSQNFIQLVALAILGAGQDRAAAKVAAEIHETHDLVMEELRILRGSAAIDGENGQQNDEGPTMVGPSV